VKRRNAAAHGALGILTLSSITDEDATVRETRAAERNQPMTILDPSGKPANVFEELKVSASLNRDNRGGALRRNAGDAATRVLAEAGEGDGDVVAARKTATAHTVSTFADVKSENVVGTLKGNDDETVVVSAHLDHLGNHPPAGGGDGI